jgi:hypothetical protein
MVLQLPLLVLEEVVVVENILPLELDRLCEGVTKDYVIDLVREFKAVEVSML